MQAALHQGLAFALMDHFDRLGRCGFTVRDVDNLETCDVQIVPRGRVLDLRCRTHQDWLDDPGLSGLHGATQGTFIAWMHDEGRHHRYLLRCRNQAIILRPWRARFRWHHTHGFTPNLRRRYDALAFGPEGIAFP